MKTWSRIFAALTILFTTLHLFEKPDQQSTANRGKQQLTLTERSDEVKTPESDIKENQPNGGNVTPGTSSISEQRTQIPTKTPELDIKEDQPNGGIVIRPTSSINEKSPFPLHDLFHFIYTTPPETITWRMKRAIEAVFFHHPNSKVILHSNSLPESGTILDVFQEAGYTFFIQPYDFETLLKESPSITDQQTQKFLPLLPERRETAQYWFTHETDIVRMLLIEKYGGVYLDTDMHLVKPIPKSLTNTLGWEEPRNKKVNSAAMIFEKNNKFLSLALSTAMETAVTKYKAHDWGIFGPGLLTTLYRKNNDGYSSSIKVLASQAFYPFGYQVMRCFDDPAKKWNPISSTRTFTVHLNTHITHGINSTLPGTVCDSVLHDYCIFCDEIYTSVGNVVQSEKAAPDKTKSATKRKRRKKKK